LEDDAVVVTNNGNNTLHPQHLDLFLQNGEEEEKEKEGAGGSIRRSQER
jgi:hypothetical protein